ncbi:MAG: GNAT family N-acetyltransferase [Vicinamibacterales bacterium]
MPRLTDLGVIRSMLERDRPWSAYALGDLMPGFAEHCEWFADEPREAIVLAFHGFDVPIVFGLGTPGRLAPVFAEVDAPRIALHIRREAVAALAPRFVPAEIQPMWRMVLRPERFAPADRSGVERLGPGDVEAVARLYLDGVESGETPDFFFPSMLEQGTFRGIRSGGELIAAAGTHLFAPALGVAAVGNVYTRRDARGRGLGSRVTAAVVQDVLATGVTTVVLNVRHANGGANRVYERIGFERYCEFVEGTADRAGY